MILASACEALLWKKNKRGPLDSFVGMALWGFVLGAVVIAFMPIFEDDIFVNFSWMIIGHTMMVNVFTMICVAAWVMVLRNMPVSIASPISLVRLVFLLFFSWLIFGGDLSIWQILCVVLIFMFCAFLGYFGGRRNGSETSLSCTCGPLDQCAITCKSPNFKKALVYMAIWVASLVALEMFAQSVMVREIHAPTYVFVRFGLLFFMSIPVLIVARLIIKKKRAKEVSDEEIEIEKPGRVMSIYFDKYLIGIGILWALASTFFNALLQTMNVGVISAINTASVPIVVLGGVFLFREKVNWYSYIFIACILALAVGLSFLSG